MNPAHTLLSLPDDRYLPAFKIQRHFDVHITTLRRWGDTGRLATIRSPSGNRLYSLRDVARLMGVEAISQTETVRESGQSDQVCYARVSSAHQEADLKRQEADLVEAYPDYELISDIGSGMIHSVYFNIL